MLDVLLLNPAEKIRLFSYILPLGLAGIGALLEQNGFRVQAIDFALYAGDFERELKNLKPVIVGIGGTTATRHYSYQIARLVKKISPDTIVVYGGVHASFTAAETLENVKEIDYVIKGEGEYSLLLLSEKLIRGKEINVHDISGLSYRIDGKIVDNPSCRIENLNALPIAARHLFPPYTPFKLDFLGLDADVIITSRGCPAHCVFCSASRMFPGGVRYRSADHVRTEVEYILSRQKIMALKLFDSTFTANLDHVRSFCAMIKPYRLKWECEIRADEELSEDVLSIMHDAGCCYVNMGLETSNQALLQKIAKNIIVPHADRIMDICKKLSIKTKVFFTFGHIDQTYQECLADLAYMRTKKDKIDFFAVTMGMRVYPGTALEKIVQKRKIVDENFTWYSFRPSYANYLILELANTLVLFQQQLHSFQFVKLIIRLVLQRTLLTREYIYEFIVKQSVQQILKSIFKKSITLQANP